MSVDIERVIKNIKVERVERSINVKRVQATFAIHDGGRRGEKGDTGEGVPTGGTAGQILTKDSGTDYDTSWQDPTGAVDSVNGQTGVVVLDADDIDDTSTTHKFVTSADLTTLSNTSGTNTGDQDLSGYALTSSLGSAATADTTDFATAAQGSLADTAVQPGDLATVATTGDYDDLSNKPTIPTKTSDLTNDSSFITSAEVTSFETVSKNLKAWDYTLSYTGDSLTSITYTSGAETITKTLGYAGDQLTTITLSGDTPSGIELVKTLTYTGDSLTGVAYA